MSDSVRGTTALPSVSLLQFNLMKITSLFLSNISMAWFSAWYCYPVKGRDCLTTPVWPLAFPAHKNYHTLFYPFNVVFLQQHTGACWRPLSYWSELSLAYTSNSSLLTGIFSATCCWNCLKLFLISVTDICYLFVHFSHGGKKKQFSLAVLFSTTVFQLCNVIKNKKYVILLLSLHCFSLH